MTATEKLRKLLDERGVDYYYPHNYGGMVKWSDGVLTYHAANAFPRNDPTRTRLVMHVTYPTPEQAIAATLGVATCHATSNPPVPKHWTGCSNCGSVWDFFYNICGYMGPPNFCPNCGRKVVDA